MSAKADVKTCVHLVGPTCRTGTFEMQVKGPFTVKVIDNIMKQLAIYRTFLVEDDGTPRPECADCHLPYGDPGFADLVLPNDEWAKVAPSGDGVNGLLCPTCLCRAAASAGIESVRAEFRSGPFSGWQ